MGLSLLGEMERECWAVFEDNGAQLDASKTGEHYLHYNGVHIRTAYHHSRLFERLETRIPIARLMLEKMRESEVDFRNIQTLVPICWPASSLAQELQHLPELVHVRVICIDRNRSGQLFLRNGFSLAPNERLFILDDFAVTYNTLRTAKKLIETSHPSALILGFGVFIDRSPPDIESPQQFAPLFKYACALRVSAYLYNPEGEDGCPYCKIGMPVVKM